jgi:sec-independent protein translocase protein TatB
MFNIGGGEIALILIVALLLLGPQKLPELARGLGKFMREFRRQTDDVRNMVEREFYSMDEEFKREEAPPQAIPSNIQKSDPVGTEVKPGEAATAAEPGADQAGAAAAPGGETIASAEVESTPELLNADHHAAEANGLLPAPPPVSEGPAPTAPPPEADRATESLAPGAEAKDDHAPQESSPRGK